MWSAGVILYTMLCGYQPFTAEYLKELIEKIRKADYTMDSIEWKSVSNDAKEMVQMCLQVDPKKRIKVKDALFHRWILNKQNTSPFASITLNNLQNSRQRLLT
jgi:calcium-dependent protein kinase